MSPPLAGAVDFGLNSPMTEFTIRRAHPGDEATIAAVQICAWEQTYRNILPARSLTPWRNEELERLWHHRIKPTQTASTTIVGTDDTGAVIGFGLSGGRRGSALPARSEISLLYILKKFHRHGLGRRLMRALANTSNDCGHSTTGIWVLSANTAAIRFYQSLGGILAVERQGMFGGYATHELGFVWSTRLLAHSGTLKGLTAAKK